MITAFKILLLFVIFISLLGAIGETKDLKLRDNMTYVCITSMLTFLVAAIWL